MAGKIFAETGPSYEWNALVTRPSTPRNLLTYLIIEEVLQQRRPGRMSEENAQHLVASLNRQLLCVARVGNGLLLLRVSETNGQTKHGVSVQRNNIRQADVAQNTVRDVLDEYPFDLEHALPFVLCPDCATSGVVNLVDVKLVPCV